MNTQLLHRLVKGRQLWERNYNLLAEFRRQNGHCNVQTNAKDNVHLGRWVAQQRHRKRRNRLQQWQIDLLEKAGFIWSAGDNAWHEMFHRLIEFERKHGHCNVPSCSVRHAALAAWVANQRHRRKIGTLQSERIRKLDRIGFCWAVYGVQKRRFRLAPLPPNHWRPVASENTEVRCYSVAGDRFVQYDGSGKMPTEVVGYMAAHHGEMPPYIPIPAAKTVFIIGNTPVKTREKVVWDGKGQLPEAVLQFVNENGALPPHMSRCSHG